MQIMKGFGKEQDVVDNGGVQDQVWEMTGERLDGHKNE